MRSRKELSPLLNRMRLLRNRVFHHEPIWHWGNLLQQHAVAVDLIGWFSPALRATIEPGDRFRMVYTAGPGPYLQRVHSLMMAA